LSQLIHIQLADQSDLRETCRYYGSVNGTGSDTIQVPSVALSGSTTVLMSATGQPTGDGSSGALGSGVLPIALSGTNKLIAVVRHAMRHDVGDLFQLTGRSTDVKLESLAVKIANAAKLTFNADLFDLFGSLATSKGTVGAALTVDDVYDAKGALRGNLVNGQLSMVLTPLQYSNFVESLRGEGSAIHPPESSGMLGLVGTGFQGTWLGMKVYVAADGSEVGAIYDSECFGWADGQSPYGQPIDGSVSLEIERSAIYGVNSVIGNFFYGITEIEDLRGVKLVGGA